MNYESAERAFADGYRFGSEWVFFIPLHVFLTEAQEPDAFHMQLAHEFTVLYRTATGEIVAVGIEESPWQETRKMDLGDFRRLIATGALRVVAS